MFSIGPIDGVEITDLKTYRDQRGWLTELFRNDELQAEHAPVMAYVSETLPGVVRGPHEHVDQTDVFVFIGPGDFLVRLWDARPDAATQGRMYDVVVGASRPARVIVPPGVVHAYKNVGPQAGWVFNAPNQLFAGEGKKQPVDEIRHEADPNSPYVLEPGVGHHATRRAA